MKGESLAGGVYRWCRHSSKTGGYRFCLDPILPQKKKSCVMARTGKDSDICSYIHKAIAQTRLATTTNMVSITEGILSYPIEI